MSLLYEFATIYLALLGGVMLMVIAWGAMALHEWWQGRELRALIRSHDGLFNLDCPCARCVEGMKAYGHRRQR